MNNTLIELMILRDSLKFCAQRITDLTADTLKNSDATSLPECFPAITQTSIELDDKKYRLIVEVKIEE